MPRVPARDGVELYAECHGEGVPVVISCALCTTHENWRPQVEPLVRAGARVVLWDYRGHGLSEAPKDPRAYGLDRVLDDLRSVLDWAAPGEPAVLVGHSFGGFASLHLAHQDPERARALLLVDTGPGFKNPRAQARWEAQVERTAAYLEERGCAAFAASRAAPTLVGLRPELPAARAAARAIAVQAPHGLALFARHVTGPAPHVIDQLGDIGCPALVVVGERDEAYLRASEVLAQRLPDAQRVVIPDAGHIVNLEAEEAFNEIAADFVRRFAN